MSPSWFWLFIFLLLNLLVDGAILTIGDCKVNPGGCYGPANVEPFKFYSEDVKGWYSYGTPHGASANTPQKIERAGSMVITLVNSLKGLYVAFISGKPGQTFDKGVRFARVQFTLTCEAIAGGKKNACVNANVVQYDDRSHSGYYLWDNKNMFEYSNFDKYEKITNGNKIEFKVRHVFARCCTDGLLFGPIKADLNEVFRLTAKVVFHNQGVKTFLVVTPKIKPADITDVHEAKAGDIMQKVTLEIKGEETRFGKPPKTDNFYPWGFTKQKDIKMNRGNDNYQVINMDSNFNFFGKPYRKCFVGTNGIISFKHPVQMYEVDKPPITTQPAIFPYWADADTTKGPFTVKNPPSPEDTNTIFYHVYSRANHDHTKIPGKKVFERATKDVENRFSETIVPQWIMVVTYYCVDYYTSKSRKPYYDSANTFQVVLITDGKFSYVIYLYAEDGLTWTTGDQDGGNKGQCPIKNGFPNGGLPHIGFDNGDGTTFFLHKYSSTLLSNSKIPAMFSLVNKTLFYQVDGKKIATKGVIKHPKVFAIKPQHKPTVGGAIVTVYGYDFTKNKMEVTIGGKKCKVSSMTTTEIVCTLPPGQGDAEAVVRVDTKGIDRDDFLDTIVLPDFDSDIFFITSSEPVTQPNCMKITNNGSISKPFWQTNHFCTNKVKANIGAEWLNLSKAEVAKKRQTFKCLLVQSKNCKEQKYRTAREKEYCKEWTSIYFCIPRMSPYTLTWSVDGPMNGQKCVPWDASDDPNWSGYTMICTNISEPYPHQGKLTYSYGSPKITSCTPLNGPTVNSKKINIVLKGENFANVGLVKIGANTCSSSSYTNTEITCSIPDGEGSVPITVTVSGKIGRYAKPFVYDAPVCLSTVPSKLSIPSNGGILNITGYNFGPTKGIVKIGIFKMQIIQWSEVKITCKCSGEGSNLKLLIIKPHAQSLPYIVSFAAPKIISIVPISGDAKGNIIITINGNDFGSSGTVSLGKVPCSSTFWSSTMIKIKLPAMIERDRKPKFAVVVGKKTSNKKVFTYNSPKITSLTPQNGVVGGRVTIYGTSFGPDTKVTFGSKIATIVSRDFVTIVCVVPSNIGNPQVNVFVKSLYDSLITSNFKIWTYKPAISSFSPVGGDTEGGFTITLRGSGFGNGMKVKHGEVDNIVPTNIILSQTLQIITYKCPAGAGRRVKVSVKSTLSSNQVIFTYNRPRILYLSPSSSYVGFSIIIVCKNLGVSGRQKIIFGGQTLPKTDIQYISHTKIRVKKVPNVKGSDIRVIVYVEGEPSNSVPFSIADPKLTEIRPSTGKKKDVITLIGIGFGDDFRTKGKVVVGDQHITSSFSNRTHIRYQAPALQGSVLVRIHLSGATSNSLSFVYTGPSIKSHTGKYPNMTLVVENCGTLNLQWIGIILIGRGRCPLIEANNNTMICKIPPGQGSLHLIKIIYLGQESQEKLFYNYSLPIITKIEPDKGDTNGNYLVKISGNHFGHLASNSWIRIGPYVCSVNNPRARWTDNEILCVVSPGQGTGHIVYIVVSGLKTTSKSFKFNYNPPSLTKFTYELDTKGGYLKLVGTNLGINATVSDGGSKITVKVKWQTHQQIFCQVFPYFGEDHKFKIIVGNQDVSFNFHYNPPMILSIAPLKSPSDSSIAMVPTEGGFIYLNGKSFGVDTPGPHIKCTLEQTNPTKDLHTLTWGKEITSSGHGLKLQIPSGVQASFSNVNTKTYINCKVGKQETVNKKGSKYKPEYVRTPPSITRVSCGTSANGRCLLNTNVNVTIYGTNFSPTKADIKIIADGAAACDWQSSTFTKILCKGAKKSDLAQATLQVQVGKEKSNKFVIVYQRLEIQTGSLKIGSSYDALDKTTGNHITVGLVSKNTVSFAGRSWPSSLDVIIGNKIFIAATTKHILGIYKSLTITIPYGIGKDLTYVVKHATSGQSFPSVDTISFSPPEFVDNSIRLKRIDAGKAKLQAVFQRGLVFFDVQHIGCLSTSSVDIRKKVAEWLTVKYGQSYVTSNGIAYKFDKTCSDIKIYSKSGPSVTLSCKTEPGTGVDYKFQVIAHMGETAQVHTPVSNFNFSYPQAPVITNITGCTISCPTCPTKFRSIACPCIGGIEITIIGTNFLEPDYTTVRVNGRVCKNLKKNKGNFECILPPGVGCPIDVVVNNNEGGGGNCGIFSSKPYHLCYSAPIINKISSPNCTMSRNNLVDCPKSGANMILTIHGTDFGYLTPIVLIGGIKSTNVICEKSNCLTATYVTCLLPSGTDTDRTIIVFQTEGIYVIVAWTISYVQCGTGTILNGSACKDCLKGYYTDQIGSTMCLGCQSGQYVSTSKADKCLDCSRGFYSGDDPLTCKPCSLGTFSNVRGSSRCKSCRIGKYSNSMKSMKCTLCPIGKIQSQTGQTTCVNCPSGKYMPYTGGYQCITCPPGKKVDNNKCVGCNDGYTLVLNKCTKCPKGKYLNPGSDENCKYCPMGQYGSSTGLTKCVPCLQGYYSKTLRSANTGPTTCVQCPKGQFGDSKGQSLCQRCPKGAYCDKLNMTTYNQCPKGKYQPHTGSSHCLVCPLGMYALYPAASKCIACPPGKYSKDTKGATICKDCSPGKNQSSPGKQECKDCPIGTYLEHVAQAKCVSCELGEFNNQTGQRQCKKCAKGFYRNCKPGQLCSASMCQPCPRGTFGPSLGLLRCSECLPGRYSNKTNIIAACTACPPGQAQDSSGSFVCSKCPKGKFTSTVGQLICKQCPPGKYNSAKGGTKCVNCQKGYYQNLPGKISCFPAPLGAKCVSTGQISYTVCPIGRFSNTNGSDKCIVCSIGSVQGKQGQSSCLKCKKGKYIGLPGQPICRGCDRGKYGGSEGLSICSPCASGWYESYGGNSSCYKCLKGYFSETVASPYCSKCPLGTYSQNDGALKCDPCPAGQYQNSAGQSSCIVCPSGTMNKANGQAMCLPCLSGQFGRTTRLVSCDPCPRGKISTKVPKSLVGPTMCSDCPAGKYSSTQGQFRCRSCLVGKYSNTSKSVACTNCPMGHFADEINQKSCQKCPIGKYSSGTGYIYCKDCPPGRYNQVIGSSSCRACSRGRFSGKYGSNQSFPCPVGKYQSALGMSNCALCGVGEIANKNGLFSCTICPPGKFSAEVGASICIDCLRGRYAKYGHQKRCERCPKGRAQNKTGATSCRSCPINEYQDKRGQTTCLSCGQGTFSRENGPTCRACPFKHVRSYDMIHCEYCEKNSIPNDERSKCYCDRGYASQNITAFHNVTSTKINATFICVKCPKGAVCDKPGTIWIKMETQPGYWGIVTNTSAVYELCLLPRDCPGGAGNYAPEKERLTYDTLKKKNNPSRDGAISPCGRNREGPLCAHCKESYTPNTFTGQCVSCGNQSFNWFKAIIVAILLALCLFLTYYFIDKWNWRMLDLARIEDVVRKRYGRGYVVDEEYDLADRRARHHRLVVLAGMPPAKPNATFKLKIALGFLQICTNLSVGLHIQWPATFKEFLSFWNFANFDLISGISPGCIFKYNFWMKLWILCILPFVAILFITIFFLLPLYHRANVKKNSDGRPPDKVKEKECVKDKKNARQRWLRLVIFTLFLAYPTVSSVVLRTYVCRKIQGVTYLAADLRILGNVRCLDQEWWRNAIPCIFMVILYPIGIPIFFFRLLYRKAINRRLRESGIRAEIGFLYDAYEHNIWFFEMLDMIHKLTLVSLIAFLPAKLSNGNPVQLPTAMVVVLIYLMIILIVKPYLRKGDDRLHVLCQAELILLIMAGYVCNQLLQPDPLMEAILSVVLIAIFLIFLLAIFFVTVHAVRKFFRTNNICTYIHLSCLRFFQTCCCNFKCCPCWKKYEDDGEYDLALKDKKKAESEDLEAKKNAEDEPSYKKLYEGFPIDKPWNDDKRIHDDDHKNDECLYSKNPLFVNEQKVFADSNYDEVTGEQTYMKPNPIVLPENVIPQDKPDKEFDEYDPRPGDGNQDGYPAPEVSDPVRRRASNAGSTPADEKDDQEGKVAVLHPEDSSDESDDETDDQPYRMKKKLIN